eukprot:gene4969-6190_t
MTDVNEDQVLETNANITNNENDNTQDNNASSPSASNLDEYKTYKPDTIKAIYIPHDINKEVQEVYLPTNDILKTIAKVIGSKSGELLRFELSKRDNSYVCFPKLNIEESKLYSINTRALSLTRQNKPLTGNSILVRRISDLESMGISDCDITKEEFEKVLKFLSRHPPVYDFGGNICGLDDIISVILKPQNNFDISGDIWTLKKNPTALLNEYFSSTLGPSFKYNPVSLELNRGGPFVAFYEVPNSGGVKKIYSSIQAKVALAKLNLAHRLLKYFSDLQNFDLYGTPMVIEHTEEEFNKEKEEYHGSLAKESFEIKPQPQQQKLQQSATDETTYDQSNNNNNNRSPQNYIKVFDKFDVPEDHDIVEIGNDKLVVKHVILKGTGTLPIPGNRINVRFSIFIPGGKCVEEGTDAQYTLGEKDNCILGIEMALFTMTKGEAALIIIDPKYAYGELGLPPLIPARTSIIVHMKVKSIEDLTVKSKREYMETKAKINEAKAFKEKGNMAFNKPSYGSAINFYKKAKVLLSLKAIGSTTEDEWNEIKNLGRTVLLNLAMAYSKLPENRWDRTLKYSNKALVYDDDHSKVYYWISLSYQNLGDLDKALEYIIKAKEIDTNNPSPLMKAEEYDKKIQFYHSTIEKLKIKDINLLKKVLDSEL